MDLFWTLVIGLIVGIAARLLLPGRAGGILMTITLGLGGAVGAGVLCRSFGWHPDPLSSPSIIASMVGAILVLVVFGLVAHRHLNFPA
jgi:uncharacterized membrane protein YeaQ/YmgE (transglycosylase-associated protein family)